MKTAIVNGASGNPGQAVVKKLMRDILRLEQASQIIMCRINSPKDKFEEVVVDLMSGDDSQR